MDKWADKWNVTVSGCEYIIMALVFAILIRGTLCVFKAFAIGDGEQDQDKSVLNSASWRMRFLTAFKGFSPHASVNDYWLPVIIGVSELVAYPVLLQTAKFEVIGGWLVIKAAGGWGTWVKSRTAYNRFLVGNILALAFSYYGMTQFIAVTL